MSSWLTFVWGCFPSPFPTCLIVVTLTSHCKSVLLITLANPVRPSTFPVFEGYYYMNALGKLCGQSALQRTEPGAFAGNVINVNLSINIQ
jgi:hypothetical protein